MRPDWWEYIADEPAPAKPTKPVRYRRGKNEEPVAVSLLRLGYELSPKLFTAREIAVAKAFLQPLL